MGATAKESLSPGGDLNLVNKIEEEEAANREVAKDTAMVATILQ